MNKPTFKLEQNAHGWLELDVKSGATFPQELDFKTARELYGQAKACSLTRCSAFDPACGSLSRNDNPVVLQSYSWAVVRMLCDDGDDDKDDKEEEQEEKKESVSFSKVIVVL